VSVSVLVRGETNVWAAPVPFAGAFAPEQAELFDRPAELARDSGRHLELRQYYAFDLVPRRAGTLAIPELHVPYFDPATRSWGEARAPGLAIEVAARAAQAPAPEPPPALAPEPPARRPGLAVLAAIALLAALGGAAGGWLVGRRGPRVARRGGAAPEAVRELRARLAAALAAGDASAAAAAAARGLRLALDGALPGARGRTAEELAALAEQSRDDAARGLVALLARLEAARFAETPGNLLALAREAEQHLAARPVERAAR
jgi:hypothetical protein